MNEQKNSAADVVAPAVDVTDPPEYLVDFVGSMPVTRSEHADCGGSLVAPTLKTK